MKSDSEQLLHTRTKSAQIESDLGASVNLGDISDTIKAYSDGLRSRQSSSISDSDLSQPGERTSKWERVLDHSIKAIVSIHANHTRSFDGEGPGSYHASGFIVDKKKGIILSNRHVVSAGPIVAKVGVPSFIYSHYGLIFRLFSVTTKKSLFCLFTGIRYMTLGFSDLIHHC